MTHKKQKRNIFEPVQKPVGTVKKASRDREWVPEEQFVEADKVAKKELPRILPAIYALVIVGFCLLFLVKLMNLQIAQGQEHRLLAEDNRIRSHLIEAPRGQIVDSAGNILVDNTANYVLQVFPYNLPSNKGEYNKLIDRVSKATGAGDGLAQRIAAAKVRSFDPVVVKEDIDRNEALKLMMEFSDAPGVEVVALPKRQYSNQELQLAHVLGYVGKMSEADINNYPDYPTSGSIGKTGVESAYDGYLRGTSGEKQVEIDSAGHLTRTLKSTPPQTGSTVKLHLISGLQNVLADKLKSAIDSSGGKSGAAIALDPRTGGILSLVSLPGYDLNIFSGRTEGKDYAQLLQDPSKPLINRAINGLFPPGSSIKPFVASGGLDAGVIQEDTTINTPPEIKIGDWVFPDWKPHGSANVIKAIAESNNIFFYAVGGGYDKISGLGSDRLKKYLDDFGFDSKTGIDIAGEQSGLVPDRNWRKKVKGENWYIGDTYHMAIGQGDLLVTPMEEAIATAAIANSGTLYEPRVASEILSAEDGKVQRKITPSIKAKNFINSDSLRIVRDGMRQTIVNGSGTAVFGKNFPVDVAGKTGTAQFGNEGKTHAWFTSFAPFNDPKIVVTVFIEGGGEGYNVAAPVAKAAYEWYDSNKEALK